jgi:peptidyl-prolyl isomerase E (cyclophilin E)
LLFLSFQKTQNSSKTKKKNTKTAPKHRGFAFVTFSSPADAQDAIDNMDLNEMKGKVLRVNLARPMKAATLNPQGNRASAFFFSFRFVSSLFTLAVLLVGLLNAD